MTTTIEQLVDGQGRYTREMDALHGCVAGLGILGVQISSGHKYRDLVERFVDEGLVEVVHRYPDNHPQAPGVITVRLTSTGESLVDEAHRLSQERFRPLKSHG